MSSPYDNEDYMMFKILLKTLTNGITMVMIFYVYGSMFIEFGLLTVKGSLFDLLLHGILFSGPLEVLSYILTPLFFVVDHAFVSGGFKFIAIIFASVFTIVPVIIFGIIWIIIGFTTFISFLTVVFSPIIYIFGGHKREIDGKSMGFIGVLFEYPYILMYEIVSNPMIPGNSIGGDIYDNMVLKNIAGVSPTDIIKMDHMNNKLARKIVNEKNVGPKRRQLNDVNDIFRVCSVNTKIKSTRG